MKKLLFLSLFGFVSSFANAQLIDASFGGGIPVGWTSSSELDFEWEIQLDLGIEESACLWVDMGDEGTLAYIYLEMPWVDLTTVTEPEIKFSTAIIKNNFMTPDLWLCYDTGDGWQRITGWGDGFGEPENTISTTFDPALPLSEDAIDWVEDITYDLSAFADEEVIRFAFEAQINNGGWVMLDNVLLGSALISSVAEEKNEAALHLYPNPTNGIAFLQSDDFQVDEITVFDVLGNQVAYYQFQTNPNLISLDFNDFEKGVYLVSVLDAQQLIHTERLIIH